MTDLTERIQADLIVEEELPSLLNNLRLPQSHPYGDTSLRLLQGAVKKDIFFIFIQAHFGHRVNAASSVGELIS